MSSVFSVNVGSSKCEVRGGGFGIPGRAEIFVASATKPLVRNLKGTKI